MSSSTSGCSSSSITQTDLSKNARSVVDKIVDRLGCQVWRFEARRIAQMLSKKERKPDLAPWREGEIDSLDNYSFTIDSDLYTTRSFCAAQKVKAIGRSLSWPATGSPEHLFRQPVIDILNACTYSLKESLDKHAALLYSPLEFTDNSSELAEAPAIIGTCNRGRCSSSLWKRLHTNSHIIIPVVVSSDFAELISKTASHASSLFNATPFRQFALTIAFNSSSKEFTFLIFHRGGQTWSHPLSVEDDSDMEHMQRIFLAIMTWESEEDAGIPSSFNGVDIHLPLHKHDREGHIFRVRETLSSKDGIRGRVNHVFRVSSRRHGTPCQGTASGEKRPVSTPNLHSRRNLAFPRRAVTASRPNKRKVDTSSFAEEERQRQATSSKRIHRRPGLDRAFMPMGHQVRQATGSQVTTSDGDCPLHYQQTRYVKPVLHRGPEETTLSTIESLVVKYSCNEDKDGSSRCIEADVLEKCGGVFGIAKHHCSFPVCTADGMVMSNHLFVPGPNDSEEEMTEARLGTVTPDEIRKVERITPWIHVTDFAGESLLMAETPKKLLIAVFHCMLGWLGMLCRLYFHRDISIGNLLMTMTATLLEKVDVHHQEQDWEAAYIHLGLEGEPTAEEAEGQVKRLQEILEKLGISEECHGSLIDCDLVCDLRSSWNSSSEEKRSGTYEFMSVELIQSIEMKTGRPYLQTPLDDLFSFYYVCQWAAAFHEYPEKLSDLEGLRDQLSGSMIERNFGTCQTIVYGRKLKESAYGPFLVRCQPFLREWYKGVEELYARWDGIHQEVEDLKLDADQQRNFYIRNFIVFAREGVMMVGNLLINHLDKMAD